LLATAHGGTTLTVWKKRRAERLKNDMTRDKGDDQRDKPPQQRDPWMSSPFYKTQVETHSPKKGKVLAVAMTEDGRRIYASVGAEIVAYVKAKRGASGKSYQRESTMAGHVEPINALVLYRRYLFSTGDDGTVKIWRLRGSEPLQSAVVSYTTQCFSLAVFNTTDTTTEFVRDDSHGFNVAVGSANGTVTILPFSLRAHWLQGAIWRAKIDPVAVCKSSEEPVTALAFAFRRLYVGTATGALEVYHCVRGDEDKDTLEGMVSQLQRRGVSKASAMKKPLISELDAGATAALADVVRLEHLYSLRCHADAVTGFCLAGGLFFSCSRDMAVVGWQKPAPRVQQIGLGAAAELGGHPVPPQHASKDGKNHHKPPQKYLVARVPHRAAVTAMVTAGDFLVTSDADGFVLLQRAEKYREIVESVPTRRLTQEQLEVEVIEKPKFFGTIDLATMKPRHFLAHVLAHYYPPKSFKKDLDRTTKAVVPASPDDDLKEEPDVEHLDDPIGADDDADVALEDEDEFFKDLLDDADDEYLDDALGDDDEDYYDEDDDEEGEDYEDEDEPGAEQKHDMSLLPSAVI